MRRFIYLIVVAAVAILLWFLNQGPPPVQGGPRPVITGFTTGSDFSAAVGRVDSARSCQNAEAFIQLDRVVTDQALTLVAQVEHPGALEVTSLAVPVGKKSVRLQVRGAVIGPATISMKADGQACTLGVDCPSLALAITGGQGCRVCEPETPLPRAAKPTGAELSCDRSTFYVDARAESATPCDDFPDRLRAALTEDLKGPLTLRQAICQWAGSECVRPCASAQEPPALPPGHEVRIDVTPVLPDGPGHTRFHQVRFMITRPGGERALEIPTDYVCDALDRLHAAVERVSGEMQRDALDASKPACQMVANPQSCRSERSYAFNVGLECPLRPTQAQTHLATGATEWHLARLRDGAPVGGGQTAAPAPTRVWLLDTGLEAGLRDPTMSVETFGGAFPDPPTDPDRYFHGSAMARLIRQMAPTVPVTSVRVFGQLEETRTADLARALHAVGGVAMASNETALINLSLGWPAEFSQPVHIQGLQRTFDTVTGLWRDGICDTTSDGVGEPVRFALGQLAQADAKGAARISVFAAGGNLPPVGVDLARRVADFGVQCDAQQALKTSVIVDQIFATYTRGASWTQDLARQDAAELIRFAAALSNEWVEGRSRDRIAALVDGLSDAAKRELIAVLPTRSAWCVGQAPAPPRPFLPGGWGIGLADGAGALLGAPKLKVGADCRVTPLVTAIGAIDARDRLVLHHDGVGAPELVAPGAHVWVQATEHPPLSTPAGCSGLDPVPQSLPISLTGTSVSTALATGLAADAQRRLDRALSTDLGAPGARPGLDAKRLRNVLRAGAKRLASTGPAAPPSRLSACRLSVALSPACRSAMKACRELCAELPAACDASLCAAEPQGETGVEAGYPPASSTCTPAPAASVSLKPWVNPCEGGVCLTAHEAGVLGPQPNDIGCGHCQWDVLPDFSAVVRIELASTYPPGGYLAKNHQVLVRVPSLTGTEKAYFDLGLDAAALKPGWVGTVKLNAASLSTDKSAWKKADVQFVYDLVKPSGQFVQTVFEEMQVHVK